MVEGHLSAADAAALFPTVDLALVEEAWATVKPYQARLASIEEERVALQLEMLRPTPTDQGWRAWPSDRNVLAVAPHLIASLAVGTMDGRSVLATVGMDVRLDHATVQVWDLDGAEPVGPPRTIGMPPTGTRPRVAFGQADGRDLMVIDCGTTAQVWDSPTSPPAGALALPDKVTDAALGILDGRIVRAGVRSSTVQVHDVTSAVPVGSPIDVGAGQTTALALGTICGRTRLAVGFEDGTVRTWDAGTGRPTELSLSGLGGPVRAIALGTVDGRHLLATSSDGRTDLQGDPHQAVHLWDAATGLSLGAPLTRQVDWTSSLAFAHRAGRAVLLTAGSGSEVRAWDLTVWEPSGPADDQGGVVSVALGHAGGRTLVACGGRDGTVRLWDRTTGTPVGRPFEGHSGEVWSVAFGTVEGRTLLASGSDDNTVRLWDVATGRPVGEPFVSRRFLNLDKPIFTVAIAQVDGRAVLAACGADTLDLWEIETGRRIKAHRALAKMFKKRDVWDPGPVVTLFDGHPVLATVHDGTVRLLDLETGKTVGRSITVDHPVLGITCGRLDGRSVLAVGDGDSVQLWSPTTASPVGPKIVPLVPLQGMAVDDGFLALGTESGVAVLAPQLLADAGVG